jgi:hypothetical protein
LGRSGIDLYCSDARDSENGMEDLFFYDPYTHIMEVTRCGFVSTSGFSEITDDGFCLDNETLYEISRRNLSLNKVGALPFYQRYNKRLFLNEIDETNGAENAGGE